jgi:pyruvate-formate lyase-activating enzyme
MCDIWKANQNMREISREQLESHVAAFRKFNVQWVVLSGGEALMHSNLWTLCELLKELGCKITLLSTGLLLARHADNVMRWCDEVIVSLDGSREIHNEIRALPRAYDRLVEGVAALKGLDASFRVTARTVVQRRNYFDLPNIIDAAHAIRLDQISFLAADVSSTAFNRPAPWGDERVADVALSPNEVNDFERLLDATIAGYAADFACGFIAEAPRRCAGFTATSPRSTGWWTTSRKRSATRPGYRRWWRQTDRSGPVSFTVPWATFISSGWMSFSTQPTRLPFGAASTSGAIPSAENACAPCISARPNPS